MSELNAAHQLLQELQESCVDPTFAATLKQRYSSVAEHFPQSVKEMAKVAFGTDIPPLVREIIQISGRQTPTSLEQPTRYALMLRMQAQIGKVLTEPLSHSFVMGTLTSGNFNGMAIRVPTTPSEFLIILESGLFNFLYRLGSVMNMVWSDEGNRVKIDSHSAPANFLQALKLNPSASRCLEQLVMKYLVAGRPNGSFLISRAPSDFHSQLRAASKLFVLAHEYAHVMSGHFTNPITKVRSLGTKQIEEVQNSWAQEFEADEKGFELAILAGAMDGISPAVMCGGVALFFSAAEIIAHAVSLAVLGKVVETSSKTHPPCAERWNRIAQSAKHRFGDGACRYAQSVQSLLNSCWEEIVPSIKSHQKTGIKLAPIWTQQ